ncbi:MAG: PEP-CTERM sorting domain-containing protein [Gemmatimonadaceae bacterium]
MNSNHFARGLMALAFLAAPAAMQAQTNVSPNLSAGLGSFFTDRYAPPGFNLMNGIQGRNNVLQIDINSTSDAANRPGGQQGQFYNTQGKKTTVNTAGSWFFQSDLYVKSAWSNSNNGYVRTDLWATATDNPAYTGASAYPIVGLTNYGGALRARGYDVNAEAWINFGAALNLDAWNTFGMGFNFGTNTFNYFVNGALAGSVLATSPNTGVANVMYQAYNFNDPTIPVSGNPAYSVNWSNTNVVPEPSTYALMAAGLFGLGIVSRRRRRSVA